MGLSRIRRWRSFALLATTTLLGGRDRSKMRTPERPSPRQANRLKENAIVPLCYCVNETLERVLLSRSALGPSYDHKKFAL